MGVATLGSPLYCIAQGEKGLALVGVATVGEAVGFLETVGEVLLIRDVFVVAAVRLWFSIDSKMFHLSDHCLAHKSLFITEIDR